MTAEQQSEFANMHIQDRLVLVEMMINDVLQRNPFLLYFAFNDLVDVKEICNEEDIYYYS